MEKNIISLSRLKEFNSFKYYSSSGVYAMLVFAELANEKEKLEYAGPYVGYSNRIGARISSHFSGNSSFNRELFFHYSEKNPSIYTGKLKIIPSVLFLFDDNKAFIPASRLLRDIHLNTSDFVESIFMEILNSASPSFGFNKTIPTKYSRSDFNKVKELFTREYFTSLNPHIDYSDILF